MKWPEVINELLALHEGFRRLKYPSSELFVSVYTSGVVQFVLQHNNKEFVVNVAIDQDIHFIAKEWPKAVQWWNKEASEEERTDIVKYSTLLRDAPGLVNALVRKGVYPPKDPT